MIHFQLKNKYIVSLNIPMYFRKAAYDVHYVYVKDWYVISWTSSILYISIFSNILLGDLTIIPATILHQYMKGSIVATARKLQGIYQLDIVLKIACLICAYNTQS